MTSKKVKKMLAIMLAASMCASVCACGSTDEKDEPISKEESQSSVEKSSETVEAEPEPVNYWDMLDEVSDTSELPDWTGDTLEVNIWVAGGTTATFGTIADTNVTFKELERVTGVKFNFEECFGNNGDNIDAVIPRLIAGGDLPNIVSGWDIGGQLRELYDNGYLADLTSYYENGDLDQVTYWAPMELFDSVIYQDARTEDGEYYLIPQAKRNLNYYATTDVDVKEYDATYYNTYGSVPKTASGLSSNYGIYVRDDILQALYPDSLTMEEIRQIYVENGTFTEEQIYDIPLNSAEDFVDFLYDVEELLATGDYVGLNGSEMEVTFGPNSETDNWGWMYELPQLVNGFANETDYFVALDRTAEDESSVLTRAVDMDIYKDWMKTLNTLVNDEIISQNSLVDNAATFNEKLANAHYAVIYGNTPAVRPYNVDGSAEGWGYRPVWVNTPINDTMGGITAGGSETYYGIFKDTLTDEEMDQLIHCINYLYSPVGMNNFYWGPESAGLYEVDADGNRYYTDKDLEDNVLNKVDNGAALKYGIIGTYAADNTFSSFPKSYTADFLMNATYLVKGQRERVETDAQTYYNPGVLKGKSLYENVDIFMKDSHAYGYGSNFAGIKEFWTARAGFENQMKKVMAATTDNFEKAYSDLIQFCEDNSLTAESVQEFNDGFVEVNRDALKNAGIIK